MTQALALRRMLHRAGHRVSRVVLGRGVRRPVPPFFLDRIDAPVTCMASPTFAVDEREQGVQVGASLWNELGRIRSLRRSLATLRAALRRHQPDVVVNFFEPMTGLYYGLNRPTPPMVAIAHQYMFRHSAYQFPAGRLLRRSATKGFARLTAWGATRRLALSLYPAPDRPSDNLMVMPPLLRPELFELPRDRAGPFILLYVLNSGYADQIVRWHRRHPEVRLHCFWDRPNAEPVQRYDETLTFHRLDDERFLEMMARCRGVATTAGFESVAEAMYLGKPVQVVPVEGHFEQQCNARDAARAGAAIWGEEFDLDLLLAALPDYKPPGERFRAWIRSGEERFVQAIERAAGCAVPGENVCPHRPQEDFQKAQSRADQAGGCEATVGSDESRCSVWT